MAVRGSALSAARSGAAPVANVQSACAWPAGPLSAAPERYDGATPPQTDAALLVWPPQSAWKTARAGASANQRISPAVRWTAVRAAAAQCDVRRRKGSYNWQCVVAHTSNPSFA